eukprot:2692457-Pyramimonas_sp.AAC.1
MQDNTASFYGSSCANNGKDAPNTLSFPSPFLNPCRPLPRFLPTNTSVYKKRPGTAESLRPGPPKTTLVSNSNSKPPPASLRCAQRTGVFRTPPPQWSPLLLKNVQKTFQLSGRSTLRP